MRNERQHVTFHARVAGVALSTTIAVLMAACVTFMLMQWAVAREQARASHEALAAVVGETIQQRLGKRDYAGAGAALQTLQGAPGVVSAQLLDPNGVRLASYVRTPGPHADAAGPSQGAAEGEVGPSAAPASQPAELSVVRRPLTGPKGALGEVVIQVDPPSLAALAPQFVALTAALFFAGVGIALFLARGLAHRIIAPVESLSRAMREVAVSTRFEPMEFKAQDALFRSLTDSFNHLLGKLDARERALQRMLSELVEARDAANAANVLKSQFLANMSHEIRTPLNGVLAMADVMARGALTSEQRERLEVIRQSGGVLLSVLNDVLDLSKIEAGKFVLADEPFELGPSILLLCDGWRVMARDKGLKFSLAIAPEARGWWRGDADRINQILGNLVSNAIKFTLKGSVDVVIELTPRTGALRLEVTDTGVGIPSSKIPSLFEKFTQADSSATRRFGGSGLGLAICRELTQMMGGHIRVSSREGVGSTFIVELPLRRLAAPVLPVQPAPVTPAAPQPEESADDSLRILAAEDNPTNQHVLRAVMEALGLDVEIVRDGAEALASWRKGTFDLILMDIQMPVMDGMEAARAIRREEAAARRTRTPILALTANALSHQIEEYMAAGMDGHVAKPIEIEKLYEAICLAISPTESLGTPDVGGRAA